MLTKPKHLMNVALLCLASALLLCACGKEAPSSNAPAEAAKPKIAVITQALNSEFWNGFTQGAKDAGKELGFDVMVNGPMAETMVTEQIAMIEAAISQKPAALLVAANQPSSILPTFELATKAGIPVFEVDVEVEYKDRVAYIGFGNYEGGKLAGEWFLNNLPAGSEVAVIRGALGDPTHDLRVNGMLDVIKGAGDKLKVVTVQPANSERGIAVGVMENIMTANPNVMGVFASNDEMALGAQKANEGIKKEVKIIGFDGNMDALLSIKSKALAGTVFAPGYKEAKEAVKLAVAYLKGDKPKSPQVFIPPSLVDAKTVEETIKQIEALSPSK